MMDGYSVTEAASVLGVPTERVWELLARGVLSGRPEGETGMRVFLQPRSQPAAPAPAAGEPSAPGNGSDRAELSPFRELLTEFRNLTERYGQALLALGEARGEVASLRSRVDLLEARMELRLPFGAQTAPTAWPMAPAPIDASPAPSPAAEEEDAEAHRSRRRGARRATESFAEALARAEDPSIPDLPPATAAVPSTTETAAVEPRFGSEPSLPREVAPAEPMPVADEPEAAVEMGPAAVEIEPAAEVVDADSEAEPMAAAPAELELPSVDDPWAAPTEPAGGDEVAADAAEPAAPVEFDEDRYTTAIEAPDWFAAEVDASEMNQPPDEPAPGPLPTAMPDGPDHPDVVAEESEPDAEAGAPDIDEPPADATAPEWPEPELQGSPEAPPDDAPTPVELADDRGADEMEVAGGASPQATGAERAAESVERPTETAETAEAAADTAATAADTTDPNLPGSSELDQALAQLDELRRRTNTTLGAGPSAGPTARVTGFSDATRTRPVMTAGPATRAYRRLRRIFPD